MRPVDASSTELCDGLVQRLFFRTVLGRPLIRCGIVCGSLTYRNLGSGILDRTFNANHFRRGVVSIANPGCELAPVLGFWLISSQVSSIIARTTIPRITRTIAV